MTPPETVQRVIDPACLTQAQRHGACIHCHKRWPRPTVHAGNLPDFTPVYACPECADSPDLNGDHHA